jgi:putative transposase
MASRPRHSNWGGARPGAGRPPNGEVSGVSHLRRPAHDRHEPLRVTLQLQPGLPSLRSRQLRSHVQAAIEAGADRFGLQLLDYSLQQQGLELLVMARDRRALARGIQGISIRIARAVNRELERKGRLFADRYDVRAAEPAR